MEAPVSFRLEGSAWENILNAYREWKWENTEP